MLFLIYRLERGSLIFLIRERRSLQIQEVSTSVGFSSLVFDFFRSSENYSLGNRRIYTFANSSNRTGLCHMFGWGFYSHIFLVPQKTDGKRPFIDLSVLNTYLVVPHFKMVTNHSIGASILPGIWTVFRNLVDAYFHCQFRAFRFIPISSGVYQSLD